MYFILADHRAYNYLKMHQKSYSNVLNKRLAAVSCSCSNLQFQIWPVKQVVVYYFSFSSFGNLSPDYLGGKILLVAQDPFHFWLSLCPGGHLIVLKANICSKLALLVASRKLYSLDYFLSWRTWNTVSTVYSAFKETGLTYWSYSKNNLFIVLKQTVCVCLMRRHFCHKVSIRENMTFLN